jgi:hypothetical protein
MWLLPEGKLLGHCLIPSKLLDHRLIPSKLLGRLFPRTVSGYLLIPNGIDGCHSGIAHATVTQVMLSNRLAVGKRLRYPQP